MGLVWEIKKKGGLIHQYPGLKPIIPEQAWNHKLIPRKLNLGITWLKNGIPVSLI